MGDIKSSSGAISSSVIRKRIAVNTQTNNCLSLGMRHRIIVGMRKEKPLVARNVHWLIEEAGTNPTALSIAIGSKKNGGAIVPQPTLFRMLEGETKSPRNSTLQPIADYFGVKLSDLLEWDFEAHGRPLRAKADAPTLTWDQVLAFMYAKRAEMSGDHMAAVASFVDEAQRESSLRFKEGDDPKR